MGVLLELLEPDHSRTAFDRMEAPESRIDRFIDPGSGDSYQVDRAMEAFMNGGMWGRGPGEGTIKAIPYFINTEYCPVIKLKDWISFKNIQTYLSRPHLGPFQTIFP